MGSSPEIPNLALLGCGIFARDAYLPIVRDLKAHLSLRFVWSRSEDAAKRMLANVREFSSEAEAEWGEDGMERILASPQVHGCLIVLPILSQPRIVLKALRAGKHVLQEKPIAGTVKEGIETLRAFTSTLKEGITPAPIWAVAENFRFEPAFYEAQKMIKKLGKMVVFQVNIEVPMNAASKYFLSEWRRDPSLKGAFITDCGVHFVSGLRVMLGGSNITTVSALATHRDPTVPPPDTLTAILALDNGCSGVMVITYSSSNNKSSWRVVCSDGAVEVERGFHDGRFGFTVKLAPIGGQSTLKFVPVQGLQQELIAFLNDVQNAREQNDQNTSDDRSSPAAALQDLAIVETALSSGLRDDAPIAMQPPIITEATWTSSQWKPEKPAAAN